MNLPTFTAEASFSPTTRHYAVASASTRALAPAIVASDLSTCGSCNCPGQCCEKGPIGCHCTSCFAEETGPANARFIGA